MENSWNKKVVFFILGFLAFSNVIAWLAVFQLRNKAQLEVNFFDVGQGDSIFIQTKEGHQVLIDGGPNSVVLEKLGEEMPFWDRTIDLVILSHPEKDHMAGLIEVLKRYKVENVLWTGIIRDTTEYKEWIESVENERAAVFTAKAGQKIFFGRAGISIIYPLDNMRGQLLDDSNETSIVAKLQYGKNSFLFTGDIGEESENMIIANFLGIDSDVLKISHHGSKYSTFDQFIKAVSPQVAVIQAGRDNDYGHPSKDVLDRLSKYGISILRTDQSGDIEIFTDGEKINYQ